MSAKVILNALQKHARGGSNYMYRYVPEAIVTPSEGLSLNYADLLAQVTNLSKGLLDEGFGPSTRICASLPNTQANVQLQLACAITGTTLITCKEPSDLESVAAKFDCQGTTSQDFEWLTQKSNKAGRTADILTATGMEEFAFYNGAAKETKLDHLVQLARVTSKHFQMTEKDIVVVPVSLNHTMGMAFGVLPALLSGAAVVLPSATPDPALVVKALADQQATLLIADTHLMGKVNELGQGNEFQAFRGGLVKVGSGEDISTVEVRSVLNVTMETVGVVKN